MNWIFSSNYFIDESNGVDNELAFAQMEFERSDIDEASARHYFNDNGDKRSLLL